MKLRKFQFHKFLFGNGNEFLMMKFIPDCQYQKKTETQNYFWVIYCDLKKDLGMRVSCETCRSKQNTPEKSLPLPIKEENAKKHLATLDFCLSKKTL